MYSSKPSHEDIALDPDALLRIGVVLTVDIGAARCIVQIGDPEAGSIETPDIRWSASRVGKTRVWSPPVVGEQVLVAFPAGELAAGLIIASIPCIDFPPAGNTPADLIEFEDGSLITYDAVAHKLDITLASGAAITINAPEGVTIHADQPVQIIADVQIEGDVTVTGTITASEDVIADGKSLKSHKHLGVTAGSDQSGAPA